MESLWNYGITWNIFFQSLGSWLKTPMEILSFFGNEYFFLLLLPALYWCLEAEIGIRVGVILLLSTSVNDALKLAFHGPRPYWYSHDVIGYANETTFGVPSGHTQIAAGVWGMLAARIHKGWFWMVAGVIILLIGISRLYLGVHFPVDVLLGWLIGALLLWLVIGSWKPVSGWLKNWSLVKQVLASFLTSLVLILFSLVPYFWMKIGNWQAPVNWAKFATGAVSISGAFTTGGTWFGFLAGLAWINHAGGFNAKGPFVERLLRYLLGLVGVLIFYLGLKVVFGMISPDTESLVPYVLRYSRYMLVGAWVSAGAPWFFIKLKLAGKAV